MAGKSESAGQNVCVNRHIRFRAGEHYARLRLQSQDR